MAIVMPAAVDDNGTGTTGTILDNAKWTALGTAIDAAIVAAVPATSTAWTPSDASGAALAFTGVSGKYFRIGPLVVAVGNLTFPSTANGASVTIGGLPVASTTAPFAGCIINYCDVGFGILGQVAVSASQIAFFVTTTSAAMTNAQMSLKLLRFTAVYLAA